MSEIQTPTLEPGQISMEEYAKKFSPDLANKLKEQGIAAEANKLAAADPLPGPIFDAAFMGPMEVETTTGKISVRKASAYDITIFKKVNSPLYRQMLEMAKVAAEREDIDFNDDEAFEMIFQFIVPIRDLVKLIDKGIDKKRHSPKADERNEVKDAYRAAAIEACLDLDAGDAKKLVGAVNMQIMRIVQTLVQHGVEEQKKIPNGTNMTPELEAQIRQYQEAEAQKKMVA